MPGEFPRLKTNALAQYPAERHLRRRNRVLEFVDGTEQRFPLGAGTRKRWVLRLSQLDEGEVATLAEFFEEQLVQLGSFSFRDPWDGTVYPDCSFESDALSLRWEDESGAGGHVVIRENG